MKGLILTENRFKDNHYSDDTILKREIENAGGTADIKAWDSPSIEPQEYDFAIVRTCWDYQGRLKEYLDRLDYISGKTRLFNSIKTIKWNTDKFYLSDLDGIPVINCFYLKSGESISQNIHLIKKFADDFGASHLVIKPTVSASGDNTFLVAKEDVDSITDKIERIFKLNKTALIQPFIESVKTVGERSLIVIDGKCVSAVTKFPAKDGFLIHEHYGGRTEISEINSEDQSFVDNIVTKLEKKLGEIPLFMRVDILEGNEKLVLELELNEPHLHFIRFPDSARALAKAISKKLLF